ncbi:MAG: hypothetical protein HXY27_09315 [Hydrogenophilaceae bacterium]|nr:hypothetical protein [Hydrogenophilaceae bacterium]
MIISQFSTGAPTPELVAETLQAALQNANADHANSVLLFLTPHFTSKVLSVLQTTTRVSRCLQVSGSIVSSLLTDVASSQGRPACAALVFTESHSFQTGSGPLCECWFGHTPPQKLECFTGALISPQGGPASPAWRSGRLSPTQQVCINLPGTQADGFLSQGAQALTAPLPVSENYGQDLVALGSQRALPMLARELPVEWRALPDIPINRLAAGLVEGNPEDAIPQGRYRLLPIQGTNAVTQTVTLSETPPPRSWIFWAQMQPDQAERNLRHQLIHLQERSFDPLFGLVVSTRLRGLSLPDQENRDLALLRKTYPGMPFIGIQADTVLSQTDDGHMASYPFALAITVFNQA